MSLLTHRRALLTAKGINKLPYEYQQVEYLESTGTQYIDTEFIPHHYPIMQVEYQAVSIPAPGERQSLFGSSIEKSSRFLLSYNGASLTGIGDGFSTKNHNLCRDKKRHICVINTKTLTIYIDDILAVNANEFLNDNNFTVLLFAFNRSGVATGMSKTKIFFAKCWNDDTLVRDFIPCYRKADNEAGLYDLVNGKFYTNKGTGEFILGNGIAN